MWLVRSMNLRSPCRQLTQHSVLSPQYFLIRLSAQKNRERAEHDLEVEPERPVLDVEEVEPDHLVEREPVATRHLPEPRHPRLHVEPFAVPERVRLDLVRNRGSRPDQTHVATQDVQE